MRTKCTITVMALLGLLCQWSKAELYNDGGVHDVLSGSHDAIVIDCPPPPAPSFTTLNYGGTATTMWLGAFSDSRITMNGGTIEDSLVAQDNSRVVVNDGTFDMASLYAYDHSQVTINGGLIDGYLMAHDNSQVTMHGGLVLTDLRAYDNSQVALDGGAAEDLLAYGDSRVTITDHGGVGDDLFFFDNSRGTFSGGAWDLATYDNSRLTIDGGRAFDAVFCGNSQVTINSGEITYGGMTVSENSKVTVYGGSISDLYACGNGQVVVNNGEIGCVHAYGNSRLMVVGSGFSVYSDLEHTDLIFSGYGDLMGPIGEGWLWGTLANGDLLEGVWLEIGDGGRISLVPVPGAVVLALLGLSAAGWRLRRRTF
jgi:hypothetical protein